MIIDINAPLKLDASKEEEDLYWELFYQEHAYLLIDRPELDNISPSALLDEVETWNL